MPPEETEEEPKTEPKSQSVKVEEKSEFNLLSPLSILMFLVIMALIVVFLVKNKRKEEPE